MMEHITSLKNAKVTTWKSLKDRKGRKETGCFLVEGRKMVEEAIASAFPVEAILVDDERLAEFRLPENVAVFTMPGHVLAAVCDTKIPQGIAAVVRITEVELKGKRLVAMDGVQDPGNVGTIIRTADAAGFEGIILSGQCADVFSPKVLRATMGSIFRMGIRVTDDLPGVLQSMVEEGTSVLSSQLDGEPFYQRSPLNERFVLVIGSEGNGVTDEVKAIATHKVKLPMRGGAESLNAAVAAGIMMYELTRDLGE